MLYIFLDHKVFWDLANEWRHLFQQQGIECQIIREITSNLNNHLVVMFGLNHYNGAMPRHYIAVQLEQSPQSQWFDDRYRGLLRNALSVWDYSITNYQALKSLNRNYTCVTLGYGSTYRVTSKPNQSDDSTPLYDVAFMGQLNDRRRKVISELQDRGLTVKVIENAWGDERIHQIRQARVLVNIHFYEKAILEVVRLSYLLSNDIPVISETSCDPVLDYQYKPFCTMTSYDNLVDTVVKNLKGGAAPTGLPRPPDIHFNNFTGKLPFDQLNQPEFKRLITSKPQSGETQPTALNSTDSLDEMITNSRDIKSVDQSIENGALVVRLNRYEDEELPHVSIVTITRNRRHLFDMPIRNFELFRYPEELLEWVIVDDSDPEAGDLTDILPNDPRILYIRVGAQQDESTPRNHSQIRQLYLETPYHSSESRGVMGQGPRHSLRGSMPPKSMPPIDIGLKRNIAIEHAQHDYLVMMDDDDYYYPLSLYSRIAVLLSYPEYKCVGVADLDVYDIHSASCASFQSPNLAEASLAFTRQFWQQQQFPEQEHSLGEGYPFTKSRRDQLIKMPSCFNMIAITHGRNFTGKRRQLVSGRADILKQLDFPTKMFLLEWAEKWGIAGGIASP